jgi:hypothetical protein
MLTKTGATAERVAGVPSKRAGFTRLVGPPLFRRPQLAFRTRRGVARDALLNCALVGKLHQ